MASTKLGYGLSLALVAGFLCRPTETLAQLTLPNVTVPGITVPGIMTTPTVTTPTVTLPGSAPSIGVLDALNVPANLNLPLGANTLLVNLPGVSILVPNLAQLASLGGGALGVVLNQSGPVDQQLAAVTRASLLDPVDQLLDNLTSRGSPSSGPLAGPAGLASLGVPNLWMWNALSISRTEHSGFGFQAGSNQITGSTLPTESIDKASLPGILWDASHAFGLQRGTLHLGVSGGVMESDVQIKATDILRSAGFTQAGSAHTTAWSVGGLALLTTRSWYAGGVVGGSWAQTEGENFLLRTSSEYDTSGFTSAWILGTILPLADVIRFDVRGSLGYQRTVGDAHVDTLGIGYGQHTIEAATASLSGRLFGVFQQAGGLTLRPYVQAGVSRRFHYQNELQIGGVDFSFNDTNTSVFAAAGLDLELNQALQLSVGMREEHSSDFDSLSGRVGVTLKLN